MSWKNKFVGYTTSTAFQLSLSHNQCRYLLGLKIAEDAKIQETMSWDFLSISIPLMTVSSLLRKGLIQESDVPLGYVMTPAGRKVVELVEMALPELKPMAYHGIGFKKQGKAESVPSEA